MQLWLMLKQEETRKTRWRARLQIICHSNLNYMLKGMLKVDPICHIRGRHVDLNSFPSVSGPVLVQRLPWSSLVIIPPMSGRMYPWLFSWTSQQLLIQSGIIFFWVACGMGLRMIQTWEQFCSGLFCSGSDTCWRCSGPSQNSTQVASKFCLSVFSHIQITTAAFKSLHRFPVGRRHPLLIPV